MACPLWGRGRWLEPHHGIPTRQNVKATVGTSVLCEQENFPEPRPRSPHPSSPSHLVGWDVPGPGLSQSLARGWGHWDRLMETEGGPAVSKHRGLWACRSLFTRKTWGQGVAARIAATPRAFPGGRDALTKETPVGSGWQLSRYLKNDSLACLTFFLSLQKSEELLEGKHGL